MLGRYWLHKHVISHSAYTFPQGGIESLSCGMWNSTPLVGAVRLEFVLNNLQRQTVYSVSLNDFSPMPQSKNYCFSLSIKYFLLIDNRCIRPVRIIAGPFYFLSIVSVRLQQHPRAIEFPYCSQILSFKDNIGLFLSYPWLFFMFCVHSLTSLSNSLQHVHCTFLPIKDERYIQRDFFEKPSCLCAYTIKFGGILKANDCLYLFNGEKNPTSLASTDSMRACSFLYR